MEEEVHTSALGILKDVVSAVEGRDVPELRKLSNKTIHNAGIYQDKASVSIAVLSYSLSKVYERYKGFKGWAEFDSSIKALLKSAVSCLEKYDHSGFEGALERIFLSIRKLDERLKRHIMYVIHKARISKASRLCEHGISVERTAGILGISQFELMDYIGSTWIADVGVGFTIPASKRLSVARRIFK